MGKTAEKPTQPEANAPKLPELPDRNLSGPQGEAMTSKFIGIRILGTMDRYCIGGANPSSWRPTGDGRVVNIERSTDEFPGAVSSQEMVCQVVSTPALKTDEMYSSRYFRS